MRPYCGRGRLSEGLRCRVPRHLREPKEFERPGFVKELLEVPDGFADAPRRWFFCADRELRRLGVEPAVVDPAAYVETGGLREQHRPPSG